VNPDPVSGSGLVKKIKSVDPDPRKPKWPKKKKKSIFFVFGKLVVFSRGFPWSLKLVMHT
jgi:hypothetical protein